MGYLKGKDLRHKGDGHTLECWYNSMPSPIIYKTDKIETISVMGDTLYKTRNHNKKPSDFEDISYHINNGHDIE